MAASTPTFVLSGAHEFLADAALEAVRFRRSDRQYPCVALRDAYNALPLDAGYLSAAELDSFRQCGRPSALEPVGTTPAVRRLRKDGVELGLVLFPPLAPGESVPSPEALRAVLAAGASLAGADVVVGLSPWGFQAERHALPRLDGTFDMLLGAGAGAPFPLDITPFAPGVIWSRSDVDGRHVIELNVSLPVDPGALRPREWLRDIDVRAREWPLTDDIPADQRVFEALAQ